MNEFPLFQDYKQQRPSQELVAKDLHGVEWRFRHIYRGTFERVLSRGLMDGNIDVVQCCITCQVSQGVIC